MVTTIHLTGRITETGELEVKLPDGLKPGAVQIELTVETPLAELPWELRPWTEAELKELLKVEPKTGAEIVAWLAEVGGWEDDGTSGAEWVERVRRQEQERRGW